MHQALLFNKNIFIVKELAKRINDINQSDERGRTPLLLTVGDVNSEVRRYIIRRALLQGVERPREFGSCCYWDKCENEKGKMGESIGKSRISYLDLCNANENDMVTYARDPEIREVFEGRNSELGTKFPILGAEIRDKYYEGKKRLGLIDNASRAITELSEPQIGKKLPQEMGSKVASYLSNVDLKVLVQLISPSRVDKI